MWPQKCCYLDPYVSPLLNIFLQLQGAHTEKKGKNLSFHNFPRIMHKWCCVAYLQLYLLEIFQSGQKILSSQEVLKEEFSKYLSSARAWQSWRPLKTRWQIWASIIISCHSWMRFNLLSVMLMHLFHAHITFLFPEHMLPNRFWTGLSMMPEGWARRKAKFFRQRVIVRRRRPRIFFQKFNFVEKRQFGHY